MDNKLEQQNFNMNAHTIMLGKNIVDVYIKHDVALIYIRGVIRGTVGFLQPHSYTKTEVERGFPS